MTIDRIDGLYAKFHEAVAGQRIQVAADTALEIAALTGPAFEQPPEMIEALRDMSKFFASELLGDAQRMHELTMVVANSERERLQLEQARKRRRAASKGVNHQSTIPEYIMGGVS